MIIKIKSREELKNLNKVIWGNRDAIRISNYDVFNLKDDNYPKYFKYKSPLDTHCCGDFYEVRKEDYVEVLKRKIADKERILQDLQEELKEEIESAE